MENLKETSILKFRPDTLHTVRKMFDLDKPGRMDEAIDILDQWIKKQNHFVCKEFERSYLERAIIINKGSIEKTKSKLDKLFTVRTMMPKIFDCELITQNEYTECAAMPMLTKEGYRIYIQRSRENLVIKYTALLEVFRDFIPNMEYHFNNDYITGIIGVIDLRTLNWMEALAKSDISLVRTFASVVRCYGFRVQSLHFISSSKSLQKIVSLLKPAFPAKITNRVHIHSSPETVYDYIPRELLSKDYGGAAPPLSELNEGRIKEVTSEEHLQHMKKLRQCLVDESKRLGEKPDMFLPGTFRYLTVD